MTTNKKLVDLSNVGLYIKPCSDLCVELILYKQENKSFKILGSIIAYNLEKYWEISFVCAKSGYGPTVYDLFLAYIEKYSETKSLIPSRFITEEAQNIWVFYYLYRKDIKINNDGSIQLPSKNKQIKSLFKKLLSKDSTFNEIKEKELETANKTFFKEMINSCPSLAIQS